MNIAILTPTRQRPGKLDRLIDSVYQTASDKNTIYMYNYIDDDENGFIDDYYGPNLAATNTRHDIIPVVIEDPRDMVLPKAGMLAIQDSETSELSFINTMSSGLASLKNFCASSL